MIKMLSILPVRSLDEVHRTFIDRAASLAALQRTLSVAEQQELNNLRQSIVNIAYFRA